MKVLPSIVFFLVLSKFVYAKVESPDFASEILPILSNKCFACHGPDTKKKDLVRLDLEELAKRDLGGYHAIDPSELEESELLFRIVDEDDPMPPKEFEKTLSAKEKELIKNWVISGAEYALALVLCCPVQGGCFSSRQSGGSFHCPRTKKSRH